jgi:hypothetical protein
MDMKICPAAFDPDISQARRLFLRSSYCSLRISPHWSASPRREKLNFDCLHEVPAARYMPDAGDVLADAQPDASAAAEAADRAFDPQLRGRPVGRRYPGSASALPANGTVCPRPRGLCRRHLGDPMAMELLSRRTIFQTVRALGNGSGVDM